jgi:deoxyribodipyrimidine photolyase
VGPPPGTLKTGALRARFLLEAVEDLKGRLQDNIVIKLGKPEVEVPRMAKALGATTVYAHRELAVVKGVKDGRRIGCRVITFESARRQSRFQFRSLSAARTAKIDHEMLVKCSSSIPPDTTSAK